jgi:hypothetical protein
MPTLRQALLLTVSCLLVFACKDAGGEDEDMQDSHAARVESCINNCLMPLCSGNITPSPDYDSVCRTECEDRVTLAEVEDCSDEYEALLTCIEEQSCETYYLWYEQQPDAPCTNLEAELVSVCSSIDLRDTD